MTLPVLFYFIAVVMTFFLTGGLAWFAWHRPGVEGARAYAWLAGAECLLALMELLSMLAASPDQALFWHNLRFLFLAVLPIFWLFFAVEYGGRRDWFAKRLLVGLLIVPVLTQIVIWSNDLHGLWVNHEVDFMRSGPFWITVVAARVPGPWFMVHSFYGLFLLIAGIGMICFMAWKRRRYAGQAVLLAAGAAVVLAAGLIALFNLLPQTDFSLFTPAVGLSALFFAFAVFRFQLLKVSPLYADAPRLTTFDRAEKRSVAMLMLIFLVSASGIGATAYVTYRNYAQSFVTQVGQQLAATASLKVDGLQDWRQERLADAGLFYDNAQFSEQVRLFLETPENAEQRTRLLAWIQKLEAIEEYDRILLLDAQGVVQLIFPGNLQTNSDDLTDYPANALASHQILFLDFHRYAHDPAVFLSIMTPIYDPQTPTRPLGVLVLQIDPSIYLYPFLQKWPVPSQSAETLLVRREGDKTVFLNPLRFQPDAALSLEMPLSLAYLPATKAVLGQTGIVEGVDYRDVPVVADVRGVAESPWFLVSKMDQTEVYAPLRARLWQTVIFFSTLIVLSGVGLLLVWRQQQDRARRARYAAAEALRVSEEKFRKAFMISPDAVAISRLSDGNFVTVNLGFTQILGYTEAEAVGKTSVELGIWAETQDRDRLIKRLRAASAVENFETCFCTKDGEIRYTLISATLLDLDGTTHILSVIRDITERRRAEIALRETIEARLRLIEFAQTHSIHDFLVQTLDEVCELLGSPIGFYHFVEADQHTLSFQAWSTRTLQTYCQAEGEGLHYDLSQAGVWADCVRQRRPLIHNDYASLPNRRGLPDGHAALVRELVVPIMRDDQTVAILGVGNKAQDYTQEDIDRVAYFADVVWEIIVRKRAEESLRQSEEKLRSMFQLLPVGVSVVDPDRNVTETNPALAHILDIPVDGLLKGAFRNRKYYRADGTQMLPDEFPSLRAVKEQAVIRNVEIGVEKEDGSMIWTSVSAAPLLAGSVAVTVDVTARKQAQEMVNSYAERLELEVAARTQELHDAQEKLLRQERLAALGQLAGSIGHELRNPLGVISNAVYFLKMAQPQADDKISEYLNIIDAETHTSNKIVTDLLDFTRIKSVDRGPVAIPDLIRQTLVRHPLPPGVDVTLMLPPELPRVFADPQHVVQILGNLTVNACQAMPDGGVLTLSATLGDDTVAISVQDTGAGIASENMAKLFEPLFTTRIKGVGLGLAVCKKLVEANAGSIQVQSQPGAGSTFTLVLPLYQETA